MNFIKKFNGNEERTSSSCCGVDIKEVTETKEDSCCVTSNQNESSCCS